MKKIYSLAPHTLILITCFTASSIQSKKTEPAEVFFQKYEVKKQLKPSDLAGISNDQIDDHWKLYEGYVGNVNKLNNELTDMRKKGEFPRLAYDDRRRRYGFEYNGMVLHELYFANLTSQSVPLKTNHPLYKKITGTWGRFKQWQDDFVRAGMSRGTGWAILYIDPTTHNLTNHFIEEHGQGHIAGFNPLLVMDVWEHAYMVDHKADGRSKYIENFMKNIDWKVVGERYNTVLSNLQITRY